MSDRKDFGVNRHSLMVAAFVLSATVVTIASSAGNGFVRPSCASNMQKKLTVQISLADNVVRRSEPTSVTIRITNTSDTPVPVGESGIVFYIAKEPEDQRVRIVRGELFAAGFSKEHFVPAPGTSVMPDQLAQGACVEFNVNLAKGIWLESTSSIVDFNQGKGLYPVPTGSYYLSAEFRTSASAKPDEKILIFKSNELEVILK